MSLGLLHHYSFYTTVSMTFMNCGRADVVAVCQAFVDITYTPCRP